MERVGVTVIRVRMEVGSVLNHYPTSAVITDCRSANPCRDRISGVFDEISIRLVNGVQVA